MNKREIRVYLLLLVFLYRYCYLYFHLLVANVIFEGGGNDLLGCECNGRKF